MARPRTKAAERDVEAQASDPGALAPDHIFVTSTEAGYFPGTNLTPVVSSIAPTGCPLGPPADVTLVATGSAFAFNAAIAFGTNPDGTPRFERTTHEVDGTLSTVISAGYFPNPDNVTVFVANDPPHGPRSAEFTFAIA
jgi:hypothetical protein